MLFFHFEDDGFKVGSKLEELLAKVDRCSDGGDGR